MTVRELIEKLQKLDEPDTEVAAYACECNVGDGWYYLANSATCSDEEIREGDGALRLGVKRVCCIY